MAADQLQVAKCAGTAETYSTAISDNTRYGQLRSWYYLGDYLAIQPD
jgi:hypothetical protein